VPRRFGQAGRGGFGVRGWLCAKSLSTPTLGSRIRSALLAPSGLSAELELGLDAVRGRRSVRQSGVEHLTGSAASVSPEWPRASHRPVAGCCSSPQWAPLQGIGAL
jgi:hypothetical protein